MPSPKEVEAFIALLKRYDLYQPEELYKVVCPFHGDVNASMQINIPKAFFYCYGCSVHGSSTELYQQYYKKRTGKSIDSFKANLAITKILAKSKTDLVPADFTFSRTYDTTTSSKLSYKEGIIESRNYYCNLPSPNWYRPSKVPEIEEESRECLSYMLKRGFSRHTLTKAQAKPSLNKNYPIIIPLLENGIFRGYVTRTFDKEIEQQRKYLYNRGFKRERTLPGDYKHTKIVLVVEGYLDCLKAKQLGFEHVVALLGWKISSTQLSKLQKAGVEHIICGTDNDAAGVKGYNYIKLLATQQKWFKVSRVHFPKGIKDFGDLNKGTKQADRIVEQLKKLGLT